MEEISSVSDASCGDRGESEFSRSEFDVHSDISVAQFVVDSCDMASNSLRSPQGGEIRVDMVL